MKPLRLQIIPKSAVISGQFTLSALCAWSIYQKIKVIVQHYVEIEDGKIIRYLEN